MAPVYLDCAATTPIEPEVLDEVVRFLRDDFGNAGSRTHEFGTVAKRRVQLAREQVAATAGCEPDEVVFTSGATESNNLALVGLAEHGAAHSKRHIITTAAEHKAVLEPLAGLEASGFEVDRVAVGSDGRVDPNAIVERVRPDTLVVSVMHANNETGIVQPIDAICEHLSDGDVLIHADAAQTYGKLDLPRRVDLFSLSGHKLFAPKGIGALIARKRGFRRTPLHPLVRGGGQERGLRAGTQPVALIAGLGAASELASTNRARWSEQCTSFRQRLFAELDSLSPVVNGDGEGSLPHIVNLSFPGIDSEAAIVATKHLIAISNGSACTSASYAPSHVLAAMGLPPEQITGALRLSWCHRTEEPDWVALRNALARLQTSAVRAA